MVLLCKTSRGNTKKTKIGLGKQKGHKMLQPLSISGKFSLNIEYGIQNENN